MQNHYDFIPGDTLFCRDSRPLAAGAGFGRGANWPLPNTLHEALRAALLRAAGLTTLNGKSERVTKWKAGRLITRDVGTSAFDWLHLHGPFPVDDNGIWFPTPRDLQASERDGKTFAAPHRLIPSIDGAARSDFSHLPFLAAANTKATKEELPKWMPGNVYTRYLDNQDIALWPRPELWDTEHRIGIGINAETHSVEESQIYAAEHLRLREDVRLRFAIQEPARTRAVEAGKRVEDLIGSVLTLGGERRFGVVQKAAANLKLPVAPRPNSNACVKWVLLTPAIFSGGWLPGWIERERDAYQVKLTQLPVKTDSMTFRSREERRAALQSKATPIKARLIAACIGKAQPVSGWDLLDHRPNGHGAAKQTWLMVPSGSVYYFETENPNAAERLIAALHGRCRSDFFGEKGLGLGVCGIGNTDGQVNRD